MRYLLDVSALVALAYEGHEFNGRVQNWVSSASATFLTCPLTELGVMRILSQSAYGLPLEVSRTLLLRLKSGKAPRFGFLSDDLELSSLLPWVKGPKQLTDGHLLALAKKHGAELATLDEKIPGGFLIPLA